MSKIKAPSAGFTLLELLLAISITVIISAGAYQILAATSNAISRVMNTQSRLRPLQDLQWSLRHDLHSLVSTAEATTGVEYSELTLVPSNNVRLEIPGPNRTSFLRFNPVFTLYSKESGTSPSSTLRRGLQSGDWKSREFDDAFTFEGVSLSEIQVADASGKYFTEWPPASIREKALRYKTSSEQTDQPSALQMTVQDVFFGQVILEVGLR